MLQFGIFLALAGIILLIAGLAQYLQNRSYAACSENIIATITKKRKRNVKNGVSYELTASYTVNGSPYEKFVGATKTEYDALLEGSQIELKYKPSDPRKAVRPRDLKPRNMLVVLTIGLVLTVVGVVLYFIGK